MRRLHALMWMLTALHALSAHAQSDAPAGASDGTAQRGAEGTQVDRRPKGDTAAIESARAHFNLGVDFYRERNFRAALLEFQRAYADAPHYKLLYNLGQAARELQEYAAAIEYFSEYLRQGGEEVPEARVTEVEQTIRQLESRLAHVSIVSNQEGAEIYVDDTLVGTTPLRYPVRVGAGRHKFSAFSPGLQPVERIMDVAAGDRRQLELEFQERSAGGDGARPPIDVLGEEQPSMAPVIALGVTTGVLAAGAITMSVLTAVAENKYARELEGQTTEARLNRLRDGAKTRALVTDVLWGATLVSGLVTTVLIFTQSGGGSESSAQAQRDVDIGIGPSGIMIDGRF